MKQAWEDLGTAFEVRKRGRKREGEKMKKHTIHNVNAVLLYSCTKCACCIVLQASSSVVIGDVDCTVHTEVASEYGVSG